MRGSFGRERFPNRTDKVTSPVALTSLVVVAPLTFIDAQLNLTTCEGAVDFELQELEEVVFQSTNQTVIEKFTHSSTGVTSYITLGKPLELGNRNGQFLEVAQVRHELEDLQKNGDDDGDFADAHAEGAEQQFQEGPSLNDWKLCWQELRTVAQILLPILENTTALDVTIEPKVKQQYIDELKLITNQTIMLDRKFQQDVSADQKQTGLNTDLTFDMPPTGFLTSFLTRLAEPLKVACNHFKDSVQKIDSKEPEAVGKAIRSTNPVARELVVATVLFSRLESHSTRLAINYPRVCDWMKCVEKNLPFIEEKEAQGTMQSVGWITGEQYLKRGAQNDLPHGWNEAELECDQIYSIKSHTNISELLGFYAVVAEQQAVYTQKFYSQFPEGTRLTDAQCEVLKYALFSIQAKLSGIPLLDHQVDYGALAPSQIANIHSLYHGGMYPGIPGGPMGPVGQGRPMPNEGEDEDDADVDVDDDLFANISDQKLKIDKEAQLQRENMAAEALRIAKENEKLEEGRAQLKKEREELEAKKERYGRDDEMASTASDASAASTDSSNSSAASDASSSTSAFA